MNMNETEAMSIMMGILGVYYIILFAVLIFTIICHWKIYSKAGQPGWASIIPFYNNYILFELAWGNGLLFLLLFVPIVNFVILIILQVKLAAAFGRGGGFAAGLIFLPIIFLPILAFGNSRYIGPQ